MVVWVSRSDRRVSVIVCMVLQVERPGGVPEQSHGAGEANQAGDSQFQRATPHAKYKRGLPVAQDALTASRGRETEQGKS